MRPATVGAFICATVIFVPIAIIAASAPIDWDAVGSVLLAAILASLFVRTSGR